MAVQFHVAFSNDIKGAGVIAGGPYYCARDSVWIGLYGCAKTYFGNPNINTLVTFTRMQASQRTIDDPANLQNDKVYLFHGGKDSVVNTEVMDALESYYKNFMPGSSIKYVKLPDAAHAMITSTFGSACAAFGPPYINDCDVDAAGDILKQIYGNLNPPVAEDGGHIITFFQSQFGANQENGLYKYGHVYVPAACQDSQQCKLHVAFHGCQQDQTAQDMGNKFYTKTGYNEWAEANNIIILYPQVASTPLDLLDLQHSNPQGCWDWWGYSGDNYYAKTGPQMAAVKAMVDRLTSGISAAAPRALPAGVIATIYEHVNAHRAEMCPNSDTDVCAIGSGEPIGDWRDFLQTVTLQEIGAGSYRPVTAQ